MKHFSFDRSWGDRSYSNAKAIKVFPLQSIE